MTLARRLAAWEQWEACTPVVECLWSGTWLGIGVGGGVGGLGVLGFGGGGNTAPKQR